MSKSISSMPPKKRVKVDNELVEKAFEHYRNYIDSCDDNEEGDIDEIQEIVQLLEDVSPSTTATLGSTRHDLLPIVASMAHYQLASDMISQIVDRSTQDADHDHDAANDAILAHLQASLRFFPQNCSTWSMGANYARILKAVPTSTIVHWYQKASTYASSLRLQALALLEQEVLQDEAVKEWVELLVLNGMLGVEYQLDDDDDDDEEDDEEEENNLEKEEEGYFSTSAVESTSRFMSAMLFATLGRHDDCLEELKHFDLTHRLHPHVWEQKSEESTEGGPTLFTGGVLPPKLYDAMCTTFAPDAIYWDESDYAHRGYHSYFFDISSEPANLIEEVIVNHLLPLAKKCYDGKDDIVGAEWWPHHRPIQANLGHNLHFDTDEALLQQQDTISHPIVSSVLYLTTGASNAAGATIILDQTPDSKEVAKHCWTCVPEKNAFMVFSGNLLHGVLPCPGDKPESSSNVDAETIYWTKPHDEKDEPHRLTFMVGFWTRRVPDKMQNRKVYGPCGPLPPVDSTEWVQKIQVYPKQVEPSKNLKASTLLKISPAWETIQPHEGDALAIPHGINHRFFVKGAPQCFRDSLFEDRDDDEE